MSPAPAIRYDGAAVDLSSRIQDTSTVAASPTDANETIIATLTVGDNVSVQEAVYLNAQASHTVGTNGVTSRLRIRKNDVSGTVVADSGATTVTAGNVVNREVQGKDASPAIPGQVYVATLAVGSASAGSTVGVVNLRALVI